MNSCEQSFGQGIIEKIYQLDEKGVRKNSAVIDRS